MEKKNNINVQIKVGEEFKPCGQIYYTNGTNEILRNILGDTRIGLIEV